jgi:hypothetical protein
MVFGKFKGQPVRSLPDWYLMYMAKQNITTPWLQSAIAQEAGRRQYVADMTSRIRSCGSADMLQTVGEGIAADDHASEDAMRVLRPVWRTRMKELRATQLQ